MVLKLLNYGIVLPDLDNLLMIDFRIEFYSESNLD